MEGKEITEERFIEFMAVDFPNFKITKTNLTHPTFHFVSSFYSLILKHAIELNDPEELWNLTEEQRSYMTLYHPETTFGQHVWAHNLHAAVKYMFRQLSENGTEFLYSDILFPENTPRRSFVFMALMLNFYWYANEFAVDLNSDMNACLEEVRAIQSLKAEKERLIDHIKMHKDKKTQYVESFKEIKKLIRKAQEANEEKEGDMRELEDRELSIQKEVATVEEEEQKLQDKLRKIQNDRDYYSSMIVSNQNQVIDLHQKHIVRKEECVKKMKMKEELAKVASNKLATAKRALELQQKLNLFLKEDNRDSTEFEGGSKGFQNLFESFNKLSEKKRKVSEQESRMKAKVLEAEEMIPRLKEEGRQAELEQQEIMAKGKEKTGVLANVIDELKKNHSQIFIRMRKDAKELDEFSSDSIELSAKCDELETELIQIDSKNTETYQSHVREMTSALNSLQAIFTEDYKFFG